MFDVGFFFFFEPLVEFEGTFAAELDGELFGVEECDVYPNLLACSPSYCVIRSVQALYRRKLSKRKLGRLILH
jgi:hypothetical protein